jgi:hypothetical protein
LRLSHPNNYPRIPSRTALAEEFTGVLKQAGTPTTEKKEEL